MKLKMAKNSLFAVLLRSPWWYSVLIVLGFAFAARALLPEQYVVVGIMGAFPFVVIAAMSAWRQWKLPNPQKVADALARAGSMPWADFAATLEKAFTAQGYTVTRLNSPAADLQLMSQNGAVTLVSCKRWKAANHGVEALRALSQAQQAQGAQHAFYISLASVTDNARRYAQENGVVLMASHELGPLLVQVL
jgi:restriction system protein